MMYLVVTHKDGKAWPLEPYSDPMYAKMFLNQNKAEWHSLSVLAIDYPAPAHPDEGVVANVDVFAPEEFIEYVDSGHFETFYSRE